MNMASLCILLIFTVISIANANTEDFISLHCKAEQLGQYGRQSLLECVIKTPDEDTVIRVVTWKKADRSLLVFYRGNVTVKEQGYSFAEPSWDVRNMNVSLLITNTAVEHEGHYQCMVMTDRGDDSKTTSLQVTAKYSTPTINSNPRSITLNTDGTLMCESDGGYPKGQLCWFDEHNVALTNDTPMEAKRTDGGLFQLSSRLAVGKGSSFSKYTCGVFNASGGKEEETSFKVIDAPETKELGQRKELDEATTIVAPVVVIGSLITGLLLALLIHRRRSQKTRRHSTTPLMGVHLRVPPSEVEEGDDRYPDNLA